MEWGEESGLGGNCRVSAAGTQTAGQSVADVNAMSKGVLAEISIRSGAEDQHSIRPMEDTLCVAALCVLKERITGAFADYSKSQCWA